MAAPTNTVQTFSSDVKKQDVAKAVYNLEPTKTPLLTMMVRESCTTPSPQWTEDIYPSGAPTAKVLQGENSIAADAISQPTIRENQTQIWEFHGIVSNTASKTGYVTGDKPADVKVKLAQKLKRTMEQRFSGNYGSVKAAAGVEGEAAGIQAYLTSNVSRGSSGASGGHSTVTGLVTAATNGTQRAITMALLQDPLIKIYQEGPLPTHILTGAVNKTRISALTTSSSVIVNQVDLNKGESAIITTAADIWKNDFTRIVIMPTQTKVSGSMMDRCALFISKESPINLKVLSDISYEPITATTQQYKQYSIAFEGTLKVHEKAHGIVADLTT